MANQKNRALQAKEPKLKTQKVERNIEIRSQYIIHNYYQNKFFREKAILRARLRQHF